MLYLKTLIIVVQLLSALGVIGLVLLQHGKGADMGAAFGSGASGSLFGATGSANFVAHDGSSRRHLLRHNAGADVSGKLQAAGVRGRAGRCGSGGGIRRCTGSRGRFGSGDCARIGGSGVVRTGRRRAEITARTNFREIRGLCVEQFVRPSYNSSLEAIRGN